MKKNKRKYPNGSVVICDSKRKVDGVSKSAYRVKTIGANGEPLQASETLNTKKAVKIHLLAMRKVYASDLLNEQVFLLMPPVVVDATKKQSFRDIDSSMN